MVLSDLIVDQARLTAQCRPRSPHVVTLRERICVGGAPISEAELTSLAEAHSAAVADVALRHEALSHFEVLTGLALRHFADQKARCPL